MLRSAFAHRSGFHQKRPFTLCGKTNTQTTHRSTLLADTQHSDSSFPFTPSTTIDSGWWMGSVVVSPQAALRGDSVMLNDDGRGGDSDHIDTAPTKEISLKS
ncbi:hypothetical protein BLNAU_20342 [Blattamonas nauphoetae]|uniref:Uncharacterized protein n=1 Tax=Blattamonas nauphoetae TaxID=2049346 RepID=A0ABQ9X2B9_9EUKA|nr:hypothetical protein BLNAU_20342 [Blattamonas nauphoetae]